MTVLSIVEEVRFVLELTGAMLVFILPSHPLQKRHYCRLTAVLLFLSLLSLGFFPLKDLNLAINHGLAFNPHLVTLIRILMFGSWYLFLSLITILTIRWVFNLPKESLIFIALAGYALQHMVFVSFHELIAQALWIDLPQHLGIYMPLSALVSLTIYSGVYSLFRAELVEHPSLVKSKTSFRAYSMMLLLLIFQAFSSQHIFNNNAGSERYISALSSLALCALILYAQFVTLHASHLLEEQVILEHVLHERQRQYHIEKESVDLINRKSHDLKHQILALSSLPNQEKEAYFSNLLATIQQHDQVLNLENEALNTLLTQKQEYCQLHAIRFSHMIDSQILDFISTIDLYTILGNAIDNAIECVQEYPDSQLRQISLEIKPHQQFVQIQVRNPLLDHLEFDSDSQLPKTSKTDHQYHGFGLKSIQSTLKDYEGWMTVHTDQNIFTLVILIPVPIEPHPKTTT
ncbi:hypothetical protein J2T50_001695 [Streptococcus gallinaceus]|uniref:ATP-binding protein n=1 Tax=Streptococcus gallinaceus TaxID=165758 RepID=UPI00209EE3E6|nr:ATP-binding protein [Streptococcus gallinaceus]MCP1639985.1 hypothetical protein [Streptococcus gallinaceus]MCP1770643.1 hypothetical protein [Streptococcus gallinaceus]